MRSIYILVALLITFLFQSSCSFFKNKETDKSKLCQSFEPGKIWLDQDSMHINAHGGGILFHDGNYYWFGEHKTSGKEGFVSLFGIRCYSSDDLYNWKNEGIVLSNEKDPESEITKGCIMERPKVIYNNATGKFVMWFHLELKGQGYNAARTAVAVSDEVTGPYTFIKSYRPNPKTWPVNFAENNKVGIKQWNKDWWTDEWRNEVNNGLFVRRDFKTGQMSRDMTLFVDDDGTAYHIYSSEENLTIQIAELDKDYTGYTGKWVRLFPGGHNEAPALFKRQGKYFMITSGCTGWAPNEARLSMADNIWGPWEMIGNPCVGENADVTFNSQSTFVLPVDGLNDAFIYMGDRWKPENQKDSRYVWLPITFNKGVPEIKWYDKWELTRFEQE